jgi:hypothetical protein
MGGPIATAVFRSDEAVGNDLPFNFLDLELVMQAELILKMLDCISAINAKVASAEETAKRDVDRTMCRVQDDTIAQWKQTVAAMENFCTPYKKWALEYQQQQMDQKD